MANMTKTQELEVIAKIEKLIESTGTGSYCSYAFEGCVEMARRNVEDDFANSPVEKLRYAEKKAEEAEQTKDCLLARARAADADGKKYRDELERYSNLLEEEHTRYNTVYGLMMDTKKENEDLVKRINELEDQIIKLKARLFDMMEAAK